MHVINTGLIDFLHMNTEDVQDDVDGEYVQPRRITSEIVNRSLNNRPMTYENLGMDTRDDYETLSGYETLWL